MAGPQGGATGGFDSGNHLVNEDVDGVPLVGDAGGFDSGHH
jgi:hypothetical protein